MNEFIPVETLAHVVTVSSSELFEFAYISLDLVTIFSELFFFNNVYQQ